MKSETHPEEAGELWRGMEPVVDEAGRSLGGGYRDAVVLRYFDGQSYQEIVRRLNISEAAARQRTSRGLAELREIVAKQGALAPAVSVAAVEAVLQVNS